MSEEYDEYQEYKSLAEVIIEKMVEMVRQDPSVSEFGEWFWTTYRAVIAALPASVVEDGKVIELELAFETYTARLIYTAFLAGLKFDARALLLDAAAQ